MKKLENEKYDMEKEVEYKDYKVWSSEGSKILLKLDIQGVPKKSVFSGKLSQRATGLS